MILTIKIPSCFEIMSSSGQGKYEWCFCQFSLVQLESNISHGAQVRSNEESNDQHRLDIENRRIEKEEICMSIISTISIVVVGKKTYIVSVCRREMTMVKHILYWWDLIGQLGIVISNESDSWKYLLTWNDTRMKCKYFCL